MSLKSFTHYSTGYCNAFWDGVEMVYGDACGLIVDDVVGHEMTHGVTEHTSNLTYSYESGAINESISDIFGKGVAFYLGHDTGADKWLLGEDSGLGAIRDMANPPAYNQPDKMSSPYWYTGSGDHGGVHTNSGVGNKTAYLMTDGDTFNGYTVTGIGWAKTAQIFYYTNVYLLTASSNYAALGHALVQACANLTGYYGITAADCAQVSIAAYATEILSNIPTPIAPSGSMVATSPTYKWSSLPGVTQYRYQVKKGTSTLLTKTVSPGACSGSTCSNKPSST